MSYEIGDYVYWRPPAAHGTSRPEIMQVLDVMQSSGSAIHALYSSLTKHPVHYAGTPELTKYRLIRAFDGGTYVADNVLEDEIEPLPPLMQLAAQAE